jgi:hypothetical protein
LIVIVAEPNDIHAEVVARQLQLRGAPCEIVNSADFPQRLKMSASYCGRRLSVRLANGGRLIDCEQVSGLWLRRFRAHEISPAIAEESVAAFAYHESRDLFLGWIASIANVINPRTQEWRAELKPFQLFAAQEAGLRIPRTLVSNDPAAIGEFAAANGEVIFKAMSPTEFQFTATTALEASHLAMLDSVALAPAMFQERIHAERHLRITMVDDQLFTAAIKPATGEASLDWRVERDPSMEQFSLPDTIAESLQSLRRRLGLRYGAVDMILDRRGEYVFLEINPGGQFLFVEIHLDLPISGAIAEALICGPGRAPQ